MTINEIISAFIAAKEQEKAAAAIAKKMQTMILQHAGTAEYIETDLYSVLIKTTESKRLDTDALYTDFPDIKETYGKITVSRSILPVLKAAEKTA